MKINHKWLTTHKYAPIAVPHGLLERDPQTNEFAQFDLEINPGQVIKVKYIDHFKFHANDLPTNITLTFFGITPAQLRQLLQQRYPEFARQAQQYIMYITVERL